MVIGLCVLAGRRRDRDLSSCRTMPASDWRSVPGIVPYVAGAITALGFSWLQAAEQGGPRRHGSHRRLQAVSRRRRGGPAQFPQSAGEDAGTVREVSALRHRARRGERLGQALCRRAGGGRRPPPRLPAGTTGDRSILPIRSASPTISATTLSSTIASASSSPASSGGDGSDSGSSGGGSSGGGGGGGGGSGW